MKKAIRILLPIVFVLLVIACVVMAAVRFFQYGASGQTTSVETFYQTGECRGFLVTTGDGGNFPSRSGLSTKEMKSELDTILDYASAHGFRAVFYQANDGPTALYRSRVLPTSASIAGKEGKFTFFDPLSYLCAQASDRNIEVYAVASVCDAGTAGAQHVKKSPVNTYAVTPGQNDGRQYFDLSDAAVQQYGASLCAELARYPLSGVVLNGLEKSGAAAQDITAMCKAARSAVSSASRSSRHLGLTMDGVPHDGQFSFSPTDAAALAASGDLDLLLPMLYTSVSDEQSPYGALLSQWSAAVQDTGAKMVVALPISRFYGGELGYSDSNELGYQLFLSTLDPNISGAVFSSYGNLTDHPEDTESLMTYLGQTSVAPSFSLQFDQTLAVRSPTGGAATLDSSYTKYFITGTSDPQQPLTIDGHALERASSNGVWGVQVQLKSGTNTFTFAQGDKAVTATLVVPAQATPKPISVITESSLFPTQDRAYYAGDVVTLSCVAPSGGSVTAKIGGATVAMKQKAATAVAGIAAVFTGDYTLPADMAENEVASLGTVTYTLNYNGANSTYRSVGELLGAGAKAEIVAAVSCPMAGVYTDATSLGNLASNLNSGTRVRLSGKYEGSRALLDVDGWYIQLKDIAIQTGTETAQLHYDGVSLVLGDRGEEFTFSGSGVNAYSAALADGKLTVTLRDTQFDYTDCSALKSKLFSAVTVENQDDDSAVMTLTLAQGARLAGWDITLNQSGAPVLYCQKRPVLSSTYARPLEGIRIMVDAGHGGTDVGALGAAGDGGPSEAAINLALASTLRYRLEQLGATVVMTRSDDTASTVYDRYSLAQGQRPDLYISIHHNSTELYTDANKTSYATAFYYYAASETLAKDAVEQVHQRTGRSAVDPAQAAYYVTRMSSAPSILFEAGFVSSPREQQDCCDSLTIYKTACGLAEAVRQSFVQ